MTNTPKPLRIAMVASGSGTTAERVGKECKLGGRLCGLVEPAVLIATRDDIGAITKARDLIIPIEVIKPGHCFGEALEDACNRREVDLWAQYGMLPITPERIVDKFQGRSVNQHPASLDPERIEGDGPNDFGGRYMYGDTAIAAQLAYMRQVYHDNPFIEVVAHRVEVGVDTGAIINHTRIPIQHHHTLAKLRAEMLPIEHQTQVDALRIMAQGWHSVVPQRHYLARNAIELGELRRARLAATHIFNPVAPY